VDLPEPFGPTRATNSPGATRSETSRSTGVRSYPNHTPSASRGRPDRMGAAVGVSGAAKGAPQFREVPPHHGIVVGTRRELAWRQALQGVQHGGRRPGRRRDRVRDVRREELFGEDRRDAVLLDEGPQLVEPLWWRLDVGRQPGDRLLTEAV